MDSFTLITTAITLATPYLIKTGETFAEKVGEDLWTWIKKPFSNEEEKSAISDLTNIGSSETLKRTLLEKINSDENFKKDLESAVAKAQNSMTGYFQQNINNQSTVEKQINIQDNKGNIQM